MTWVGKHLLGLNITVLPLTVAETEPTTMCKSYACSRWRRAATLIWSLLDAQRNNYEKLHQWLRLYIRIVLGMAMITIGADKVIQSQMPPPWLSTLTETYGQSSPMHLLWTFMGASRGYNAFAGGIEMLAGVLLFIPAFTAIGALVSVAVMSNVFVLNMCYDVRSSSSRFICCLWAVSCWHRTCADWRTSSSSIAQWNFILGPVLFQRKWVRRSWLQPSWCWDCTSPLCA